MNTYTAPQSRYSTLKAQRKAKRISNVITYANLIMAFIIAMGGAFYGAYLNDKLLMVIYSFPGFALMAIAVAISYIKGE